MLYNIYKNDICKDIPKEVKQVQFADDIAVFCTETRLNTRKYLLESAIKDIHKSLMEKGLEIQPKKIKKVDFNKEGIYNKRTIINCIGTDIKLCQEAKFLGITMDNKLSFENQCQIVRDKVKKANGILKYANKVSRGMEVNTALIMYKSLIKLTMDYGAPVYLDEDKNNNIQKIEKAQYLGLRTALGYRNSTPTNVMIAEAKLTTFRNRAKMLAKNCLTKIMLEENPVRKIEIEEWAKEEKKKISLTPWRRKNILLTTWKALKKQKADLCEGTRNQIYKMKYKQVMEKIKIDIETSKKEMKAKYKIERIISKIKEKH